MSRPNHCVQGEGQKNTNHHNNRTLTRQTRFELVCHQTYGCKVQGINQKSDLWGKGSTPKSNQLAWFYSYFLQWIYITHHKIDQPFCVKHLT